MEWLEQLAEEDPNFQPEALTGRPELFPHLTDIWRAFFDASNSRQIGGFGGVGGIPPSEIEAEIRRFRITDWSEQEDFRLLLRTLDNEYLTIQSENNDRESKRKSRQKATK